MMNRREFIKSLFAAIGLYILPAQLQLGRLAKNWYVSPGGELSLFRAIEQAQAGDTIYLDTDTYKGGLIIDKSLDIIGNQNEWPIIYSEPGSIAIMTTHNGTTNLRNIIVKMQNV